MSCGEKIVGVIVLWLFDLIVGVVSVSQSLNFSRSEQLERCSETEIYTS